MPDALNSSLPVAVDVSSLETEFSLLNTCKNFCGSSVPIPTLLSLIRTFSLPSTLNLIDELPPSLSSSAAISKLSAPFTPR